LNSRTDVASKRSARDALTSRRRGERDRSTTQRLHAHGDVAKALATPAEKDGAIAGITCRQASDGQLKEARATFALLTDPGETPARLVALRAIAGAPPRPAISQRRSRS
jgi:hypothetical protein